MSLFGELLRNLDVEMTIVSGPFERRTEPYLDQADYQIPVDRLKALMEDWVN